MNANPDIQAALRRLLVNLERPDEMREWRYRAPRKDVSTRRVDHSEDQPQAA